MLCDSNRATDAHIPAITCPVCGKHLFLCTIEPDDRLGERMTLICDCGFEYRQSAVASAQRRL